MSQQPHRMGIPQKRALLDMIERYNVLREKHDVVTLDVDKITSWRFIAAKLNEMGPIRKEPNEWRNAWWVMKRNVRDKYRKLTKNNVGNNLDSDGNNLDSELDRITDEDWRVIKLCGITRNETSVLRPTISTENGIMFDDPNVSIKSPPTTDDEEETSSSIAAPVSPASIAAKQLSELKKRPKKRKRPFSTATPKLSVVIPTEKIIINEPAAKEMPTCLDTPRIYSESFIPLQLATIVKSLQTHNDMQRYMLIELQENNRLQKSMISLLADIKTRLSR